MAELSLWLDYYDDIYSDFDSRHYLKRRISEDFLFELRNALKYRKERIHDLLLLLPQERRNEQNEKMIISSLKDFFNEQYHFNAEKCRRKLQRGIIWGILGIIVIIVDSLIGSLKVNSLPLSSLRVILEPAGWFLLWSSLDFLLYDLQEMKEEREFFRELAEMSVHFKSA